MSTINEKINELSSVLKFKDLGLGGEYPSDDEAVKQFLIDEDDDIARAIQRNLRWAYTNPLHVPSIDELKAILCRYLFLKEYLRRSE